MLLILTAAVALLAYQIYALIRLNREIRRDRFRDVIRRARQSAFKHGQRDGRAWASGYRCSRKVMAN